MKEIPISYLYELFDPDFTEGVLRWRPRPLSHFKRHSDFKSWNSNNSGKIAGYESRGYIEVSIDSRTYRAHRVIYAMFYSKWPSNQIDHINGNRSDNRIVNIRDVTSVENGRNRKKYSNNSSGVNGVYYHNGYKKWVAQIGRKHIGSYFDFNDAVEARTAADLEYSYHENHGREA